MGVKTTALRLFRAKAHHPNAYVWYVLVCVIDLCLTFTVIFRLGGREVNGIARAVLDAGGFWGLIGLKLLTMFVVIGACEALARRRPELARRVAEWAVAISSIPAILTLVQILQAT